MRELNRSRQSVSNVLNNGDLLSGFEAFAAICRAGAAGNIFLLAVAGC